MKSKTQIENINAIAELDTAGYRWESVGSNEIRLRCPVHEREGDHRPSVGLNVESNLWRCHSAGCGAKGDVIALLAYIYQTERAAIIIELAKRYDLEEIKEISPELVERYHQAIGEAGPLLQALYDRGVRDDDIRSARLGFNKGRITIPVYDVSGRCVNIRQYLPGAPGDQKMRNTAGYGKPRLYQISSLIENERVWICGGEIKALVAGRELSPHGRGACSVAAGEGIWDDGFTQYVKDKIIYICLDVDHGGRVGSVRIAERIFHAAREVWIVRLPLDLERYPKGDINDFIGRENRTGSDLVALEATATLYEPEGSERTVDAVARRVRLEEAIDATNLGATIETEAVVAAMDTIPYLVPKIVGVNCTKDQPGCQFCPVAPLEPNPDESYVKLTVRGTAIGILDMIRSPENRQRDAIRVALRIPTCKVAKFHIYEYWNVLDIRVSPQLALSTESSENIDPVPAYAVDCRIEMNSPYRFTGRVYPHPATQQAVLLFNSVDATEDNLANFKPSTEDLESLRVFQPSEWTIEGLERKFDTLYSDLESNVTRIFRRRDLHFVIDLCYHSVLLFNFDGQLTKGWTNSLVLGDSSQGKSEASMRLRDYYGLGEKVEGKNASGAGLLGGVQQLGNRWFISWGAIPKNDRRLVMIEELKGMPVDVLAKLTDMRSSGVAEINKVKTQRAHARTRLIMISNPRSDRALSQYNFGVEAIRELIGSLEDIRRFDVALIVSAQQIDAAEINQLAASRPHFVNEHTGTLCRRLILWGWTRAADQTQFDEAATTRILAGATELCSKFSETMPLCDRGTMRHKLARLAAAVAVRTFSCDAEDARIVRVRICHVSYVIAFLDRVYSDPTFGYLDFSKAQVYATRVTDPVQVRRAILGTRYPKDFVEHLLNSDRIQVTDISDWCELERDDAQAILSLLVRKHAVYRVDRSYVKTGEFISILKELSQIDIAEHRESVTDGKEF